MTTPVPTDMSPATAPPTGRAARFVDALVAGDEDPTALGLCRVALVAVFTASLLAHVGAVGEYFSDESMLAGEYARQAFKARQSLFFWFPSGTQVRAIFAVGVVAHVMWLVGLYTRVAATVAFAVWASMMGRNPLLYSMPDQMHACMMFLLALMPTGRGLSLDARWRGKGGPVPLWCRRVLQFQVAVVYGTTGMLKTGTTWREGTALYYSLVNPYNIHFDAARVLAPLQPFLLRPLSWAVLVWEVAFPLFVLVLWLREATGRRFFPDLRKAMLGFGVLMHLGIQIMLYVAWFGPLAIMSYSAFLRPAEAGCVRDRVAERVGAWR
jgi:hypothetical protein